MEKKWKEVHNVGWLLLPKQIKIRIETLEKCINAQHNCR